MDSESNRLNSFSKFPLKVIDVKEMAAAGLYSTGHKDITMCYVCDGVIRYWNEGDDPLHMHRYLFPECRFALQAWTALQTRLDAELGFMRYSEKRLKTFENFPIDFIAPRDFANAGLYAVNYQDCVKCFFCGGQILYWEKGDEPFKEHARLYPHCKFVKNVYCGDVV